MSRRRSRLSLVGFLSLILPLGLSGCQHDEAPDSPGASPASSATEASDEHAILIEIPAPEAGADFDALGEIEDELDRVLARTGTGEFDGNDVDLQTGGVTLYMYGPSADRMFTGVEAVLKRFPLPKGTVAIKRYGGPGAKEIRVAMSQPPVPAAGDAPASG
ncbi:hypothetical protein ABZ297_08765 [Nonomuraea sp. NPDC005983]|uniref:hypothetical protein n=1 Tax=Nonomuraea sp. NPDC005983 TaxID=3155595 RepID=UPI0033AE452C